MPSVLVDRATSDALVGPDWAFNLEICDVLNHDPPQAKDVVKSIKKRIVHKNSKVQLLALTLLETMIKNCGDFVHMHVAERDILHEMVKIAKKKPDYQVKEKILTLIDIWQEAFGGACARYPQYYAAYQELLCAGAVFPQRPDSSVPIFTPPQTQPLQNYPPALRNAEYQLEVPESSSVPELPTLSLTEIQNARGIMDVLSEMLNALNPSNREGLKQEVIVDLVDQCCSYKQRVVHLVNATSDEELLSQGLSLNDDLQRVLAKHDAISAGISFQVEKPKSLQARGDTYPLTKLEDTKEPDQRSSSSASTSNQSPLEQLAFPAPVSSSSSKAPAPPDTSPNIDLLSGDDYFKPEPVNSQALVLISDPLADMFTQNNTRNNNPNSLSSNTTTLPASQAYPAPQHSTPPQQPPHSHGATSNTMTPYDQHSQLNSTSSWNGQLAYGMNPPQQALNYDDQSALPPPPWETQPAESNQLQAGQLDGMSVPSGQLGGIQPEPIQVGQHGQGTVASLPMLGGQLGGIQLQPILGGQLGGLQSQPTPNMHRQMYPRMQSNQSVAMYSQHMAGDLHQQQMYDAQTISYGYGQQPGAYYIPNSAYAYASANEASQRMNGLSFHDSSSFGGPASSSLHQSNRPTRPEDSLFGDLVNIAKTRQRKPTS